VPFIPTYFPGGISQTVYQPYHEITTNNIVHEQKDVVSPRRHQLEDDSEAVLQFGAMPRVLDDISSAPISKEKVKATCSANKEKQTKKTPATHLRKCDSFMFIFMNTNACFFKGGV
jgi:hypothetical protein